MFIISMDAISEPLLAQVSMFPGDLLCLGKNPFAFNAKLAVLCLNEIVNQICIPVL